MLVLLLLSLLTPPSYSMSYFSSETKDEMIKAEYQASERDSQPPKCLSKKQQVIENRYTCPTINELYKQNMRWKTDSNWQGYQDSFATKIRSFMGAQWKGVGIGRVICLYNPEEENEFPIQIATTQLIIRPNYAYWDDNPKSDEINCKSSTSNPCDCQFSFYQEKKETNIETIVEGIKKK